MITIDADSNIAVTVGPPTVEHPNFIDLILRDGNDIVTIGRISATFDFSELPPEFHALVYNHLAKSGTSWWVGNVATRKDYPVIDRRPAHRSPDAPSQEPPKTWWRRLIGWAS